jgi:hypothetical protein
MASLVVAEPEGIGTNRLDYPSKYLCRCTSSDEIHVLIHAGIRWMSSAVMANSLPEMRVVVGKTCHYGLPDF